MFALSPLRIAQIVGSPAANVSRSWPPIEAALVKHGIDTPLVCLAAIATVRVEAPPFMPIHEYGSDAYLSRHYQGRADLGDVHPGDGVKYCGRGFIQLTGLDNYEFYEHLLGVPLIAKPELALEPEIAAEVFADFFKRKGCADAANARQYVRVRRLVNGGTNGLALFQALVAKLEGELSTNASAMAATV